MPQSPLVGLGCLLCSLAGWYHWLHSVIGQGYELGPTIPPDQVGYQAVFPNQMVLQMQVGPQAGHWSDRTSGCAVQSGEATGCVLKLDRATDWA